MGSRPDQRCPECGSYQFVEDRAQGDVVCTGCGLVVEAHMIDERSEWRTFSDRDKESVDPTRVGGPSNPLLADGGLSTVIGKAVGDGGLSHALNRLHQRTNTVDRGFINACKSIGRMCDQLHLVPIIKDLACKIYRDVTDSKKVRGRSTEAICAACLYLACRQENNPRTFKEITAVLPDASKKEIGRTFKEIVQMMKDKVVQNQPGAAAAAIAAIAGTAGGAAPHPEQYMKRLCNSLHLSFEVVKLCQAMAHLVKPVGSARAVKPWDGKNPISIASAIIFIITNLSKDPTQRVSMQHVVTATQVAEVTVRAAYRDMYPELAELLPKGYATPEQIARLPVIRTVD